MNIINTKNKFKLIQLTFKTNNITKSNYYHQWQKINKINKSEIFKLVNTKYSIAFFSSSRNLNQNTNEKEKFKNYSFINNSSLNVILALFGLLGLGIYKIKSKEAYCEEKKQEENDEDGNSFVAGEYVQDLPTYTEEEVLKHNKDAERIWVSYRNGVYDITDFVASHPGGEKILLGAGSSLEPFWAIYAVHQKSEVYKQLETLRIGNFKQDESKAGKSLDTSDPFSNDPHRHPLLKVLTKKPFNAETPKEFAVENLITPNELHFIRNHLPVPRVDISTYELEVENEINGKVFKFNYEQLMKLFPVYTIPVTIQCAGNKRKFMHEYEPVQGLMWDTNAISTAEWTGFKLKDLLAHCGIDANDAKIKNVKFEGFDTDPSNSAYGASIPKEKAFNNDGDVLIAFKMNGADIPIDHGYPLRAVVPGVVGARSVKWLKKISVSENESQSHWQIKDYKILSPNIKDLKNVDFTKFKAVQESPVQSAICEPINGSVIEKSDESFKIKGYAFSGGGRAIENVYVSMDDGKTWKTAVLKDLDQKLYKAWAWTIWEYDAEIPKDKNQLEILCVAIDSEQNTQPESPKAIWNPRGLINNSWHKIKVEFK